MREFCALILSSESRPSTALLYGKFPKLVCKLLALSVLRQVLVKSMNPTGVMVMPPIGICSGEVASGTSFWGGAGAGAGGTTALGAGAAGSGGTIGAIVATSPTLLFAGVSTTGVPACALATPSICFFWPSSNS